MPPIMKRLRVVAPPSRAGSSRWLCSTKQVPITRSWRTQREGIGRHGWIVSRTILGIFELRSLIGRRRYGQSFARWRNQWADRPRTADYGMQVLSRVLSYAVDPLGKIAGNPCEGIKQLYSGDRSEIIWTEADITALKRRCPAEIAHAVDLASHTGLRLGDLLRLSWSHVEEDAITLASGKSRGRREAIIPLYDGLREVLARIPKHSTVILTNQRRRPWKPNGFGTAFNRAKIRAGINKRDLHFHDLRGTAATRFYVAGYQIASSLKFLPGARIRSNGSSGATLIARRRQRPLFVSSMRLEREHKAVKLRVKLRT
jgi:integrase